jgi:hypothetical protein
MASTLRFDNWENSNGDSIATAAQVASSFQTKPCFAVAAENAASVTTGAVIPFNIITTNIGQGWSDTTHSFTVPTSGLYYFSSSILSSTTTPLRYNLFINDSAATEEAYSNSQYIQANLSFITQLTEGDIVNLKIDQGTAHGYHNFFTGFMIQ